MLFKSKKILFDGDEFVFFEKNEFKRVNKEEFTYNNGKVELIITENLYHFEPLSEKAVKDFDSEELRRYIEWKAETKGSYDSLITYKKLGDTIFSFLFPNGQTFIKKFFQNRVSGVKTFSFSVYNKLKDSLREDSLLILDYKNLFLFLAIGKESPVFLRKKLNLDEDEIITEAETTMKFVYDRFGIEIKNIFSRIEIPLDNFIPIKKDYLGEILK